MGVALAYTGALARATDALYAKVSGIIPAAEWPVHAPLIAAINRLKREKKAVILAHNRKSSTAWAISWGTAWRWPARPPAPTPR